MSSMACATKTAWSSRSHVPRNRSGRKMEMVRTIGGLAEQFCSSWQIAVYWKFRCPPLKRKALRFSLFWGASEPHCRKVVRLE